MTVSANIWIKVGTVPDVAMSELAKRQPLALQRRVAEQLEDGADGVQSRSHSRGVVVSAGGTGVDELGIDVEYADADRPWRDILGYLGAAPPQDLKVETACRAWTVWEAAYKAMGRFPDPASLPFESSAQSVPQSPVQLEPGVWRQSHQVMPGFEASIVWRGPRLTPKWSIIS